MTTLDIVKGHGSENDFVVIDDLDGLVSLSAELVRALCDRHAGVGADGVLRVLRTAVATEPDVQAQAGTAEYFMDYHNADGSIAEMCGNGIRVFARHLRERGLIGAHSVIATRGGARRVSFSSDDPTAEISVDMGVPVLRAESPTVQAAGTPATFAGIAIDMPNPHVVVLLEDVSDLNSLDLTRKPLVAPPLPEGQNVEFVVLTEPHRLRLRVYERGVGETRSCGTGICAAVAGVELALGQSHQKWLVDVPGGQCSVGWTDDGAVVLTGPAVMVGQMQLDAAWIADHCQRPAGSAGQHSQ